MAVLRKLARRLVGKKCARGPRTVSVVKKADRTPACSPEEVAVVWKNKFAEDFGNVVRVSSKVELTSELEGLWKELPAVSEEDMLAHDDWVGFIAEAAARSKTQLGCLL